ncbi:response regulator [Candidatus Falkowbacteria bacterium CG10_big_fil_rev_8_21_14_0_10_37_14]|uniref:Response regulator n=1 Tax=Candidatus Falkowbacteria bacterium CG10_big_fil_rev_8_21_14_0_10_37_14 TaxID=1974561 RepID=A0A2M6WSY3_9BACT|nr:MAG: response regulator [Candidatus Falkowbacteria bacterium CG10_big_fil_rev_8_21_14_0_10_37_14]
MIKHMTKSKTILIAEDEDTLAHTINLKLNSLGFNVETASDGEEALKRLAQGGIDLLILDLIMPKVNGFQVLEEMSRLKYQIPVVVATNLGQAEDLKRVRELGAKDYFIKSEVSIKDLVNKVATIMA